MDKGKPQLVDNIVRNKIVDELFQKDNQHMINIDYDHYFTSIKNIVYNNFVLIFIFILILSFLLYRFKMNKVKRKREEIIRNNKEIEMHMERTNKHDNEFDVINSYGHSFDNNYDNIINEIMED